MPKFYKKGSTWRKYARKMKARVSDAAMQIVPTGPTRQFLSASKFSSINMHRFCRWTTTPTALEINSTTATGAGYALSFKFSDLINSSEFTALYDRYMITKVEMYFQMINVPDSYWSTNPTTYDMNTVPTVQGRSNWYPKMWYCPDYDDTTTPSLDDIKQYARTRCAVMEPNKRVKVVLRPAILSQDYRTAVTTAYSPTWNTWVDMNQTDVPHYGLKLVLDPNGVSPQSGFPIKFNAEYKFHFTCKDVR